MLNSLSGLTWQQIGLAVFMFTSGGIWIILAIDLWLYLSGREMITDYCRLNPWAAWIILSVLATGMLGLAIHFMRPIEVHFRPRPNTECNQVQGQVVCEFIGGPYDGLLKLIDDKERYAYCTDNEIRAYWLGEYYISPGIRIKIAA